jgi:hypothetical protein
VLFFACILFSCLLFFIDLFLFVLFLFCSMTGSDVEGRLAAKGVINLNRMGVGFKLFDWQAPFTCSGLSGAFPASLVGASSINFTEGRVYGGNAVYV